MAAGDFPKVDGDVLYAEDITDLSANSKIQEIYTGNGFDSGASYELTAIPAANISQLHNYVEVEITYNSSSTVDPTIIQSITLLPEIKEIGGAYGSIVSAVTIIRKNTGTGFNYTRYAAGTIKFTAAITAGMKSNGLQLQLTTAQSGYAVMTNVQTVVSLRT